MTRQTATPQQLLTLRQAIIILSIIALVLFAFKYGQNVLRYRQLQAELVTMDKNIAASEAEKKDVELAFDNSLSPSIVDDFGRHELGWVRPGDEVIVPIGVAGTIAKGEDVARSPGSSEEGVPAAQKQNWQLWLELVTGTEQ